MAHVRLILVLTTALLTLVLTGCGLATSTAVGQTDPAASSSTARLSGIWRGYFFHPGADYTSASRDELMLQVGEDSTYTFTWATRPKTTGTIVSRPNRVILDDTSGSRLTLMHRGDTLYGMIKDPESRGRTVMVSLERVETDIAGGAAPAAGSQTVTQTPALKEEKNGEISDKTAEMKPTTRNRLCEAVGGAYVRGVCEPTTTPDWRALCEARGGTYFAGGEYCEVPAGGLRRT